MNSSVQDWNDPETVASWLANRTSGNPGRQAQLDMVVTLLGCVQPAGLRILDLGCGDGLVAELLLTRLPESYVAGIDLSPPMLEAAEARLRAYPARYALYRRALTDLSPLTEETAPFDAAIAVQSVHHLDAVGKQALFAWVAGQLRSGGLFLLSDRVHLPSAALFPYYQALYAVANPESNWRIPPGYGYAAHLASLALRGDQPDTVEDQLVWLRAAGFGEAGCFYRSTERAIFGGLSGPPGPSSTADPSDRSAALLTTDEALATGDGF